MYLVIAARGLDVEMHLEPRTRRPWMNGAVYRAWIMSELRPVQILFTGVMLLCGFSVEAADVSKEATWDVASGGNGHTYRVVATSTVISWDAANAAAIGAGGYLATITSAAENAFVFSLIDEPTYWNQAGNGHGPWIGGYQLRGASEPDGGWSWVTQTRRGDARTVFVLELGSRRTEQLHGHRWRRRV